MSYAQKTIRTLGKFLLFPFILMDWLTYKRLNATPRLSAKIKDVYPCVQDKTAHTSFDRHYIYHTAWAARKLAETKPDLHTDIGSSLYFVGIAAAFVPIRFYDFRPPDLNLSNLQVLPGDLLHLPFAEHSLHSLSCLHVLEHIGLGRYGDPLDPQGDLKAAAALAKVMATGGNVLIVVPVGEPKVRFNAHRIYSKEMVESMFSPLTLREFTLIPGENGSPIYQASEDRVAQERFGCGCFWFVNEVGQHARDN